mgnify:CR=1 FL=1
MDEMAFIGYLVSALITLGGFVAVIIKFVQPINDLRVVIQRLNDTIDSLKETNTIQDNRINKHGEQIDDLTHRVGKIETKIESRHD